MLIGCRERPFHDAAVVGRCGLDAAVPGLQISLPVQLLPTAPQAAPHTHRLPSPTLSSAWLTASVLRSSASESTARPWSATRCSTSSMALVVARLRRCPCTVKISPQACTSSSWMAARVRTSASLRAPAPSDRDHCKAAWESVRGSAAAGSQREIQRRDVHPGPLQGRMELLQQEGQPCKALRYLVSA